MIEHEIGLLLSLVNYAETLVKPAEDERTMRIAIDAIATLGIKLIAPTPAIARDAARYRMRLASFDRRVRRALPQAGLELTPSLG